MRCGVSLCLLCLGVAWELYRGNMEYGAFMGLRLRLHERCLC